MLLWSAGCAALPPNSFLNPTSVGTFPINYQENGIKRVLTPREGDGGVAGAEEPKPSDLVVEYSDYILGESDVLQISIEEFIQGGTGPWQASLEISPTGYISLPQIGLVRAAGLTESQLQQDIVDRIQAAEILKSPIVQVLVPVKRMQYFSITGSVAQAGTYPLTAKDFRILDAIGAARDIGPEATKLYVIRRINRSKPEGAAPRGAAPSAPDRERDQLVIPPPSDDEGMSGTFSALVGSQETKPVAPPDDDMDAILAPGRSAQDSSAAPDTPAGDRPLKPMIFDPSTGTAREAPAQPAAEAPASSSSTTSSTTPAIGLEGDFRWDELPEYELAQRVIEIDVRALRAGDPKQNIVVHNQDSLLVPVDTGLFYVMGEVNRPGPYQFNGREITIKQAVSLVGGFSALAWPQRCEIIRREKGTDKQITIPVNTDAIFAGLEPDVLLRDDDILNVGTHVIAPFLFVIRNSFRFTYGFGFVYDRNFADRDSYGSQLNPEIRRDQQRQQRGLPF